MSPTPAQCGQPHVSGGGISRKISDRFPVDLPRMGMENGLLDTWCCRVASLDVSPARGLVLHSLFALWPRGISFEPGRHWALELHSRALCYPVSGRLGGRGDMRSVESAHHRHE